jgi:glycosyltransferase involved in cell wall biosynthesis
MYCRSVPVAVEEVELGLPLRGIPARVQAGQRMRRARVLVRLHTIPLGYVDLDIGDEGVNPSALAEALWAALGPRINAHLRDDGLAAVHALGTDGVGACAAPACARRRVAALVAAPPASIVLCTRDRAQLLARALRSLEDLDYPHVEIIVVDGSADDQTARLVRDEFPGVHYLNVGSNGKCVALNRGIAAAAGSVVAFTDDDVVADRNWLAALVAGLQCSERVACATGLVAPLALDTPAQIWFEESGAFTEGFDRRLLDMSNAPPGTMLPYATGRIGAGVSMAWRASALRELGGFDVAMDTLTPPWPPRARHATAGEDLAAFFDALVAGYQIVFEPGSIVYHEHRRDTDALLRQMYWHGIGLGAYLARCVVRRPGRLPHFVRLVPRGLRWGFAPGSPRNRQKSPDFPSQLTRVERRGIMHGPFAYARGLPKARRLLAQERRHAQAAPPRAGAVRPPAAR